MKQQVGKIEAAVDQLDCAIKLFIDYRAYIPAITLARASEEMIGEAVVSEASLSILKKILFEHYGIVEKLVSKNHLYKTNDWLKQWKNMKEREYLEIELEAEAIQYIIRAVTRLVSFDNSVTIETPRFFQWLNKNKVI